MAALSPGQRDLLDAYLREIDRFGRRLNLTAIPGAEAAVRHIGESSLLLDVVAPAPAARVIDIGSGAGVPGVVLAILRPDLGIALLEADVRKSGFLVHVAGVLGLRSVSVLNRRAEVAAHEAALREQFDVAVSRAAAPPPVLCELALPFLRVGGRLAALVSDPEAAARQCAAASAACGGTPPQPDARGVLTVAKRAPTPERLPRRSGVPARRPLSR